MKSHHHLVQKLRVPGAEPPFLRVKSLMRNYVKEQLESLIFEIWIILSNFTALEDWMVDNDLAFIYLPLGQHGGFWVSLEHNINIRVLELIL